MTKYSDVAISAASVTAALSAIMAMNSQQQVFNPTPAATPYDAKALAAVETSRSKTLVRMHQIPTLKTLALDKEFMQLAYAEVAESEEMMTYDEWLVDNYDESSSDTTLLLEYMDYVDAYEEAEEAAEDESDDSGVSDETTGTTSADDSLMDSTMSSGVFSCYSNCHSACHGSRGWR
jgi:hypothetical protein